ncbi:Choline/ethanolamine kinase [Dictyocaulus viviparus]|uniref:Choline/ethanolamine kinase n=1 Tax=Dictyocaulus viviparus TaxID=29172 RepID=A0A0D8XCV3_DICVI|nr:Choline/ethanolamine kinase [Dictyocaulus viviparus]
MQIRRGGMSNLLFFVELASNVNRIGSEVRQALLRIHCQTEVDQLLSESVVFTLLSERSLGPKMLGVFPGGRFEQFIPSRPLQCREISLIPIGKHIAPMLARVHTLDVPISKEPEVMNCARGWLAKFRHTNGGADPIDIRCTCAQVSANSFPSSITCDELEQELNFVEEFLMKCKSPVVFSHNDLQEGNILLCDHYIITDDGSIRARSDGVMSTDPLVLIDFEYCSYNYRGFDLGNHFCEYGYDYNCDEAPYYKIYNEMFQVIHEKRSFCRAYLEEIYKIRDSGDNPNFPSDLVTGDRDADLDLLITESTLFMAVANIYWACWALLNTENSIIQFDYASYARDRLALYYNQKTALQNFIDFDCKQKQNH